MDHVAAALDKKMAGLAAHVGRLGRPATVGGRERETERERERERSYNADGRAGEREREL